jgi:hypothetical protein
VLTPDRPRAVPRRDRQALHITMATTKPTSAGYSPKWAPATAPNWSPPPTRPASSSQADQPARQPEDSGKPYRRPHAQATPAHATRTSPASPPPHSNEAAALTLPAVAPNQAAGWGTSGITSPPAAHEPSSASFRATEQSLLRTHMWLPMHQLAAHNEHLFVRQSRRSAGRDGRAGGYWATAGP